MQNGCPLSGPGWHLEFLRSACIKRAKACGFIKRGNGNSTNVPKGVSKGTTIICVYTYICIYYVIFPKVYIYVVPTERFCVYLQAMFDDRRVSLPYVLCLAMKRSSSPWKKIWTDYNRRGTSKWIDQSFFNIRLQHQKSMASPRERCELHLQNCWFNQHVFVVFVTLGFNQSQSGNPLNLHMHCSELLTLSSTLGNSTTLEIRQPQLFNLATHELWEWECRHWDLKDINEYCVSVWNSTSNGLVWKSLPKSFLDSLDFLILQS